VRCWNEPYQCRYSFSCESAFQQQLLSGVNFGFKEEWESDSSDDIPNMDGHSTRQIEVALVHHTNGEEVNPTATQVHPISDNTKTTNGVSNTALQDPGSRHPSNNNSPRTSISSIESFPANDGNRGISTCGTPSRRQPIHNIVDQHEFPHCSSTNICSSNIIPTVDTDEHDNSRGQHETTSHVLRHHKPVNTNDCTLGIKRKKISSPSRTSGIWKHTKTTIRKE
jgi:hypothetical protein